ncbi:hypothetical protein [Azospirillum brasilense]|uniref:hypothetical protein n=1 Tax=Azospirillum brasilense TaxID=192 RepID=UPI000706AC9D|nr:hypothetical protein [Azospirillum brasilense]ALJ37999.1 hypothetical protein AMK58_21640 [Azospirillum brasilense]
MKPFDRHDQLMRMFTRLKEMAQASDTLAPLRCGAGPRRVGGLLAAAAERPPEERDRLVTHAFAAVLEPCRDWPGKVKALLRFHREDGEEEANRRLLDQMLAETVDGREPVRALIGYAPDLGGGPA